MMKFFSLVAGVSALSQNFLQTNMKTHRYVPQKMDRMRGTTEATYKMEHGNFRAQDFVDMKREQTGDYEARDGEDTARIDADDEATDFGKDGPESFSADDGTVDLVNMRQVD